MLTKASEGLIMSFKLISGVPEKSPWQKFPALCSSYASMGHNYKSLSVAAKQVLDIQYLEF